MRSRAARAESRCPNPKGNPAMNKRPWRITAATAAVAAAVAMLVACSGGGGSGQTAAPAAATTLTWGSYWGFNSFDPSDPAGNTATNIFLQPVYDTLIRATADGKLVPMLATNWTYDSTGTKLTMNLRDHVTFTDGESFDAAVVKANIDRAKKIPGPAAANVALVKEVVVAGDHKVEFVLSQPDPGLLDNLAGTTGMMVAPKALASPHLATTPVGSGPYIYDPSESIAGDTYTYEKNPHYWDPGLQKFQKVVLKVVQDPVARLNAIKSGQLNSTIINPPQIQQAKASSLHVLERETAWRGIIFYDRVGKIVPALGDVRVRQAIAYAIDRKGLLAATVGGDYGTVTSQMFSPETGAYVGGLDGYYDYDPAKARQLLAEAGYAHGLTLNVPDTGVIIGDAMTAAVKQELGQVGITVNYVDSSLAVQDIFTKTVAGAYSLALGEGGLGTPWSTVSTYLLPTSAFNPLHSSTPESQDLIAGVAGSKGDAQDAAYQKLNRYVVEQAWVLPFFRLEQVLVTSPGLTVTPNPLNVAPGLYDFAPAR